jgi:2-(3-amino-3-carboxypropyl)histidine synthase
MKTLFIESKQKNSKLNLSKREISKLPKEILLLYSIQYQDLAKIVKKQLESSKIKIRRFQQVLGCSNINNNENIPILFIGTGEFHSLNLYLQSPIIYILENNKIKRVEESRIKKLKAYKRAALIKFLSAENIGILVSAKPGQENLESAIRLKKEIKKKSKKAYIFISNNIDLSQFENFKIDSWVNTACPGLSYDNSSIINSNELKD